MAEEARISANQSESLLKIIRDLTLRQESHALEIIKSIDSIAVVAEETSASTEESAAAAEEQAASMETITQIAQKLLKLSETLSETKSIQDKSSETINAQKKSQEINPPHPISTKTNELTARTIKSSEKIEDTENLESGHSESF